MNEVFDFTRLWKLMKYEVVNYIPRFFRSLLIFASVLVAVWIFSLSIDIDVMSFGRKGLIGVLFIFAVALSPYIIYKDMNNRKKGYMYAMIPASTLEKLISMFAICVICVPVLTWAVLTATDAFLWMLSNIGIGSFESISLYNPFNDSFLVVFNRELGDFSNVLDSILYILSIVAMTMMFNTIFRKNKVLKTVLFNIGVSFALIMLMATFANAVSTEFWDNLGEDIAPLLENRTAEEIISFWMAFWRFVGLLLISAYLTITYFRIKRVNY